jgi:GNAT superfamily N-acetyltransferase
MRIDLIDEPDDALRESVHFELRRHNQTSNPLFWEKLDQPEHEARALNLFAFGPDDSVLGGLFATTRFSWLKIDVMATTLEHRHKGVGRALVAEAERIARERGCRYAYVDTMEYQAPRFYPQLGYRLVGTLPDWDSHGHAKLFFVKDLI